MDRVVLNSLFGTSVEMEDTDTVAVSVAELQTKAVNAIALNQTYLAIASPTAAQVAAQVALLTRENTAIIRLLLGQLSTTAGT